MDALLLLVAFLVFMFIGIPVAYAMGLATLVTALWIDMPLEAIMIAISDGMSKFALLTIPFFVLAGAITLLFVIERLWLGEPPQTSYTFRDAPQAE